MTTGLPLYWSGRCVSYGIHELASPKAGISFEVASQIVDEGYRAWLQASCDGGQPSISVTSSPEPIRCNRQEYNQCEGNSNTWIFRDDDWPHARVANHLALTTLTYNVDTGEIFDVDVEINTADNQISIGESTVTNDLLSIVTHEAGHFFGLSHSHLGDATMTSEFNSGTIEMRTLSSDDVQGICAIYPPDRPAQPCEMSSIPRHGFSSVCGSRSACTSTNPSSVRVTDEKGCGTTAPGSGRAFAPALVLGLGALAVLLRRRDRRRDKQHAPRPRASA